MKTTSLSTSDHRMCRFDLPFEDYVDFDYLSVSFKCQLSDWTH